MIVNIDEKYAFKIKSDFTLLGFRYDEPFEMKNFGLAAAHKICELKNRIDELEDSLKAVIDELESWNLTEGDPHSIKVLKAANHVLNKK